MRCKIVKELIDPASDLQSIVPARLTLSLTLSNVNGLRRDQSALNFVGLLSEEVGVEVDLYGIEEQVLILLHHGFCGITRHQPPSGLFHRQTGLFFMSDKAPQSFGLRVPRPLAGLVSSLRALKD